MLFSSLPPPPGAACPARSFHLPWASPHTLLPPLPPPGSPWGGMAALAWHRVSRSDFCWCPLQPSPGAERHQCPAQPLPTALLEGTAWHSAQPGTGHSQGRHRERCRRSSQGGRAFLAQGHCSHCTDPASGAGMALISPWQPGLG